MTTTDIVVCEVQYLHIQIKSETTHQANAQKAISDIQTVIKQPRIQDYYRIK